MSQPHPELLVLVVALVAIGLAPLASRLVRTIGGEISTELDGGRTGEALERHLDSTYELTSGSGSRDDEIAQMLEARAFLNGDPTLVEAAPGTRPSADEEAELREEIRSLVVANNERRERAGQVPFDVDAEVARRLARFLGPN
jgi:hypothetical protein